jgi:hypothetical protein
LREGEGSTERGEGEALGECGGGVCRERRGKGSTERKGKGSLERRGREALREGGGSPHTIRGVSIGRRERKN